jgi:hypothetical protein
VAAASGVHYFHHDAQRDRDRQRRPRVGEEFDDVAGHRSNYAEEPMGQVADHEVASAAIRNQVPRRSTIRQTASASKPMMFDQPDSAAWRRASSGVSNRQADASALPGMV